MKKTPKMLAVEEKFHGELSDFLPGMVNDRGLSGTAGLLGVSKATLGYWMLKLRIDVKRVAVREDERLYIMRTEAPENGITETKREVSDAQN